jgi:hypothetical protein
MVTFSLLGLLLSIKSLNPRHSQAPVTHACNPSYSGSRDQEDWGSKPAHANSSKTLSRKNPSLKRLGSAPGVGPEFKSQYQKKNETQNPTGITHGAHRLLLPPAWPLCYTPSPQRLSLGTLGLALFIFFMTGICRWLPQGTTKQGRIGQGRWEFISSRWLRIECLRA